MLIIQKTKVSNIKVRRTFKQMDSLGVHNRQTDDYYELTNR